MHRRGESKCDRTLLSPNRSRSTDTRAPTCEEGITWLTYRTDPPLPDQRPTSDPKVTSIALALHRPPAHRLGAGSLPRSVDHRQAADEGASLRPD